MRRSLVAWLAVVVGAAPACLLQLDDEISCGDGFVDTRAGEECDPQDRSSFEDACPGNLGTGACDPETCQLIIDATQCAVCGDGNVDVVAGEECDGERLNGNVCPGGGGTLRCDSMCQLDFSLCDSCGNGIVDEGEECDYANVGGLVSERLCAGSVDDELPPLPSPAKQYSSGATTTCRTDCRWDRSSCGFCGDGVRDDSIPVEDGVSSPPEWCDGERFDPVRLDSEFGPLCQDPVNERPAVSCGSDCQSFVKLEGGCCLRRNAACPDEENPEPGDLPCCWSLTHPGEDQCDTVFDSSGAVREVCR